MKIDFIKNFIGVLISLMLITCSSNSTGEGFSADMTQKMGDDTIEGKLFVQGNQYRMDLEEQGEKLSILVDRTGDKTTIVIHSQKAAQEISSSSLQSLSNNPFESYKNLLEQYSTREKGSETIDGYKCKEIEIYQEDQDLMTVWVSEKFDWPLKISLKRDPPWETELKNIEEKDLEDVLFQVPKDYNLSPMAEVKKEAAPVKEETEDLTAITEAILKKLEEKGIERESEKGVIKLKKVKTAELSEYFPGWHIFRVTQEKEMEGGMTVFGMIPVEKAAVSADNQKIYLLNSPGTTMPLEDGLEMFQGQGIKVNSEEDVKKLGKALATLYFSDSRVEGVESLGENQWAIYTGTFFDKLKGFIVEVNSDGEITGLNYKLKIKDK
jgi:frataxin-like iron-binding protein CyaY